MIDSAEFVNIMNTCVYKINKYHSLLSEATKSNVINEFLEMYDEDTSWIKELRFQGSSGVVEKSLCTLQDEMSEMISKMYYMNELRIKNEKTE